MLRILFTIIAALLWMVFIGLPASILFAVVDFCSFLKRFIRTAFRMRRHAE